MDLKLAWTEGWQTEKMIGRWLASVLLTLLVVLSSNSVTAASEIVKAVPEPHNTSEEEIDVTSKRNTNEAPRPNLVLAAALTPTITGIGGIVVFFSGVFASSKFVTAFGGTVATANLVGGPSIGHFMVGRNTRGTITMIARFVLAAAPIVANVLMWKSRAANESQDEPDEDEAGIDYGGGFGESMLNALFHIGNIVGMGGMAAIGVVDVIASHSISEELRQESVAVSGRLIVIPGVALAGYNRPVLGATVVLVF